MRHLVAAPCFVAALVAARPADACGGLFCSSVQSTPVDQTQERILFEVHDDGSVTSTVEVIYTGDPREFSWIVPVTEVPTDLGVVSPSTLRLLDVATAPVFTPPTTVCSSSNGGGGIGAFACSDALSAPRAINDVGGGGEGEGEVQVTELANVGPYGDIVVIDSADPDALIEWLNDNDYLVTDPMKPLIAQYASEGQKFMAMKLLPDAGTQDIVPVRFTCPPEDGVTGAPHIPIRLTGIAAVPEMSIVVFIAGAARFAPLNYRAIEIPTDDVRFDPGTGQFNYYALASARLDDEGGAAFVVERAQGSEATGLLVDGAVLGTVDEIAARAELAAVLSRRAFVTRLYTRLNPEEMNEDPVFGQVGGLAVLGVHDLSDRTVEVCASTPVVRICGDVYCGQGAECAENETGAAGCVCAEGQVARRVLIAGKDQVTCQAQGTDFLGDILLGDASPCAGFSCGDGGRCVAINGAPTCACAPGLAAVPDNARQNGVVCVEAGARFSPDELLWPGLADEETGTRFARDPGCGATFSAAARPASSLVSIGAFLLAVVGFSRVLRRRR